MRLKGLTMRRSFKVLLAFLLVICSVSPVPAETSRRPITEKDLFHFVWLADPQLSPDGATVAFVRVTTNAKREGYDTELWSVPASGSEAPRKLTNGPHDTSPRWSADGKQLAFLRAGEKEGKPQPAQIALLSLAGGEPQIVTKLAKGIGAISWSPRDDSIAFTTETTADDSKPKPAEAKGDDAHESDVRIINQAEYRDNGSGYRDPARHGHLWVLRHPLVGDAKPVQLTTGDFEEDAPVWSPDAATIYVTSNRQHETYYNLHGSKLYSVPAAGGDLVLAATIEGDIDHVAPSPDGRFIAFRGVVTTPAHSHDQADLFVTATVAGSKPRNLTTAYDNDIFGGVGGDQRAPRGGKPSLPVWSLDSRTILVTTAEKGTVNLHRVDAESGRMTAITTGNHDLVAFATNECGQCTRSPKGSTTVVLVSTPTSINDLYRVDANGSLSRLTNVNAPLFDQLDLTDPEEIWYTSFDGRKIEGWIQKPPDFDSSKHYPLILNIHGGPHAAYGYTFDHEFQWMAAKGYIVLYPNPRGSTSYGEEFANIIQYRYPGDDYKDLMAGVDEVIRRGFVDPKKLGVTGGSGGGLLTNWTVTQTDRFAAAVSQRDIADWADFWYTADFSLFNPTWFHKAPWEDRADFQARSPITYIEKVHTPLMLILGEADYRTPPTSGGEQMFRALKYLHRTAVMVRFPGESHELSRSGQPWHRVERLEHIVRWFDKYLQGQPVTLYDAGLESSAVSR
jgi:dipeptidyl aminopeptidase/acylaminoacyl peptidase